MSALLAQENPVKPQLAISHLQMRSSLKYAFERGKVEKAIEIGVRDGSNAEKMLKGGVKELVLVDPYSPYTVWGFRGTEAFEDRIEITQEQQNAYRKEMLNRVAPYGDRISILNITSEQAARVFPDNTFDYIYIDGNHKYEAVKKDLEAWYPKVKKGGIFAGHDFTKPHLGVAKAVKEFALKHKLEVLIVKPFAPYIENWANYNNVSDWWINCV
jgi:hypothetical protein